MNKKQLIIAALATILSVSAANATSTITGITNGGSGTFNINPLKANGDVGYRYYDNFKLGQGDIANLIFRMQNGDQRAINTFINLVGGSDKAQINGILNSIRDGSFFDGHTVFMTKNGLTIGSKGVVNVGTLSVLAPTNFDKIKSEYDAGNYTNINNISAMRNNTAQNRNNYGANSPVEINGLVLARNGVDIRGSQVDIGSTAKIVNGYKGSDKFSTYDAAKTVFDALVNTNGIAAAANKISNNGSRVVIKSGAGSNGHIKIAGQIANLNKSEMAITNHGNGGLLINGGVVASNGKLNIYNNNTAGNLNLYEGGKALALNDSLSLTSKGGMSVAALAQAKDNVELVNKGGKLSVSGNVLGNKIDVVNSGNGGMLIDGNFGTAANKAKTVRFSNEKGKLIFQGDVNATDTVSFYGQSTASGMQVGGNVKAGKGILVENRAEDAVLYGNMTVTKGDLAVGNKGNGKLLISEDGNLAVNQGRMIVHNKAANGMTIAGKLTNNNGETAINNDKGDLVVSGTVNNKGTMGIINNGTGLMTVSGNVTNTNGTVKLINYENGTSAKGMFISGKVTNTGAKSSDRLYVYNGKGSLQVDGTLENKSNGNVILTNRENATHIYTSKNSLIKNDGGNIVIANKGNLGKNIDLGLELEGTITNTKENGQIAINNYSGSTEVNGAINAKGNVGIINRASANSMSIGSTITATGAKVVNIKNNGSGNMTVGGTINHDGRLNVLANQGKLNLTGTVNNTGKDMSYFAARNKGTGIDVAKTFVGNTTNGGTMLIKNITGQDGLTYAGTMKSTNGGQIEVYNMKGDLTVTKDAKMLGGQPTVILNKGEGMTVEAGEFTGDLKLVNKGSKKANVASEYQSYLKEQLK